MFKNHDGSVDWVEVFLTSVIVIGLCIVVWGTIMTGLAIRDQKRFKAKCVDAGGVPTMPYDYVKGHGEGNLCINPSAIIEVE